MTEKSSEIFEQLYDENHIKVYRLALGLTGNVNDAEEITQAAFCRAFRAFNSFRNDCSFFTWIYRITLNVANDYLKQRAKLPIYALTEDLGYTKERIIDTNPSNNPETELLANEARYKCLLCLIECLPINQRKIFCLAITIGLPHKVVAEILECSVSTVKTTLYRAKKRWLGYMENRCEFIKKSNPCHCNQWVRFALEQGWISKQALDNPRPQITIQAKKEIIELRDLRDIYQNLYQDKMDEALIQRIKEGIKNKEWKVIL